MNHDAHAELRVIEYYLPEQVLTNESLQQEHPDWNMEEVFRKTGVRRRHIASAQECASDLARAACQRLFERWKVFPSSIDGMIVCTQSPDHWISSVAAQLQHSLGLRKDTFCLDINLACSGYLYGLAICKALIGVGQLRSVLLVTADTYSKYIRPDDRSARTVFGDGAAVTWICSGDDGIGSLQTGTDGSGEERFMARHGGCRGVASGGGIGGGENPAYIQMDGLGILNFVRTQVPPAIQNLLQSAALKPEEIDQYIFHQASALALEQLRRMLTIPAEKYFVNLENLGNTVSSSIPIALRDAWDAGRIRHGSNVVIAGFGAGLSWGAGHLRITDGFMQGEA